MGALRKATLADKPALKEWALAMAAEHYPQLRADPKKVDALLTEAISGARNFCWVAEHAGRPCAVIAALVQPCVWAERQQCHVMLWHSKAAGAGKALMQELLSWAGSRRAIRVVGLSPDFDWPEHVGAQLEGLGFVRRGGDYHFYN